ncbi:MAG TPA: precorrin-3B C(17)-methyltransferase [Verrucomicrobia bacterium]|nr:precorrin-3B C(17)-methyltransferase [Verrucomicrobiota bacterium]
MVGIGPGGKQDRTHRAEAAILASDVVAGYTRYLEHIRDLTDGKQLISSGMRQETERCIAALNAAQAGATVALISSGDAGIYGMAGLALELAHASGSGIAIEIVPGVSAAQTAAARLGAPLTLDYACISLSDLLVPWETIRTRLAAVAAADLVTALYNPRSTKRVTQLEEAVAIFREHRPGTTPVGIGVDLGSADERVCLTDLEHLLDQEVDMRTVVVIGNRTTRDLAGWMVTPRGYERKRDEG